MKYGEQTQYKLFKPDVEDNVLIEDLNHNIEMIDKNFASIDVSLSTKAPIQNPSFIGKVTIPNPGATNSKDVGIAATTDYVDQSLGMSEILLYNTRNDLPETGQYGYIYLLKDEENNPELIWNGSEYIERN